MLVQGNKRACRLAIAIGIWTVGVQNSGYHVLRTRVVGQCARTPEARQTSCWAGECCTGANRHFADLAAKVVCFEEGLEGSWSL
jgi:hypothetical protein